MIGKCLLILGVFVAANGFAMDSGATASASTSTAAVVTLRLPKGISEILEKQRITESEAKELYDYARDITDTFLNSISKKNTQYDRLSEFINMLFTFKFRSFSRLECVRADKEKAEESPKEKAEESPRSKIQKDYSERIRDFCCTYARNIKREEAHIIPIKPPKSV